MECSPLRKREAGEQRRRRPLPASGGPSDRFDPGSGTRYLSYLYAIARNQVTDRLRERQRAGPVACL